MVFLGFVSRSNLSWIHNLLVFDRFVRILFFLGILSGIPSPFEML